MPQTSISGLNPYATPNDMIARFDVRLQGWLVRDDNGQSTSIDLQTDPNLRSALATASGIVEMACVAGQRYTPQDLAALTGNGAEFLKDMVCSIAADRLYHRRFPDAAALPEAQEAQQWLKALGSGMGILPFAEAAAAGIAYDSFYTQEEIDRLNLITRNTRSWGIRAPYVLGIPRGSAAIG
jgi:hypothetical protein